MSRWTAASTDQENLAVSRVKYARGADDGGLAGTNGDPQANSVYGVDFYHRVPQFLGDMDLRINLDAVGSRATAWQRRGRVRDRPTGDWAEWSVQTGTRWVSATSTALGFVASGNRQSEIEVGYRRASRRAAPCAATSSRAACGAQSWQGEPQEVRYRLDELGVRFQNDDRITFSTVGSTACSRTTLFERDGEPRAAGEGLLDDAHDLALQRQRGRPVSGEARISRGTSGGESTTGVEVDWRDRAAVGAVPDHDVDLGKTAASRAHRV